MKLGKRGMSPQKAIEVWKENTKLKKYRVKKGLSQSELSISTGIPVTTIRCYEQQRRPIDGASLKHLCNLAIALDCRIGDLLENKSLVEKYKSVK